MVEEKNFPTPISKSVCVSMCRRLSKRVWGVREGRGVAARKLGGGCRVRWPVDCRQGS